MFKSSEFTYNLTKWKPYLLEDKTDMFNICFAPQPYWYVEDTQKVLHLVDLQKKLDNELYHPVKTNKIKI